MGENGAGKSTLMKILSGVYVADEGEIRLEGQPIEPQNPRHALALGIGIVHQELSMVPSLTVGENIFPGRLPRTSLGLVKFKQLYQQAQVVLNQLEVNIDARQLASELSVANQQLVEIAKALSLNCKVLILDEPTSALTEREVHILFALLRKLAERGVGILYISHKLNEVLELTHRVTVLRDGQYIGTVKTSEITGDDIVRMMVGRDIGDIYPPKATAVGDIIFEIADLRLKASAPLTSFSLRAGEILGVSGLIGSGRTELARAIFGADTRLQGEIRLNGSPLVIRSPLDAIRYGIAYLPEDRKAAGLFLDMAISLNVEAASLRQVTQRGFIVPARERKLAREYINQLNVVAQGVDQEVRRLSGGNQQKVLLAKWLAIRPKLLIVDEPTRGIDVNAKREIHYLLRQLAGEGVGIIMISSELPEVIGMSDRVLVMHGGAVVAEIASADATEERIMHHASGQANTYSLR